MSRTFLSRTQAAQRVGRCAKTMRNLAKRSDGPPHLMIGSRPAYPADDLEAWLAANTTGGSQ
jgi:predicted DNA-binding transcriptional regulator AlpA